MRIDNPLLFGSFRTSGSFYWQASGSFTGSFQGDGSQLTGVAAAGTISSSAQIAALGFDNYQSWNATADNAVSLGVSRFTTLDFEGGDGISTEARNPGNLYVTFTLDTGSTHFTDAVSAISGESGTGTGFPFSGSADITGSLFVSGGSISGSFVGDGSRLTGVTPDGYQLITAVISEGKFRLDGALAPTLTLSRGLKYRFDTSDSSCAFNQLGFRKRDNTVYTDGVTVVGTAGQAGSYTEIFVRFDTPAQLKYYSILNGNSFGNLVAINDQFGGIFEDTVTISGSAYITERIGINTDAPAAQLHITSNTNDVLMLIEADTDDNNENDNPKITFRQDGGNIESEIGLNGLGTQYEDGLHNAAFFGTTKYAPLQLITNDVARLTILGSGSVGIGTINPETELQVVGAISASVYYGDGSQLTGIQASGGGSSTGGLIGAVTSSFINQTSITVNHALDSRQIIVSTYDTNYNEIIPQTVTLTDLNNVDINFGVSTSGNVVVTKVGEPVTSYSETVSGNSTYIITHSLADNYPSVQAYESGSGLQVLPQSIKSLTSNSVEVGFGLTFNGHITIKK